MQVTAQQIRTWLADVPDPEIPVISLVELGVIRDVRQVDAQWEVDVSPTYSGCPATSVIAQTIREALAEHGVSVAVNQTLSPPWTTDWISQSGREKLEAYGIAPPRAAGGPERCPRCHSADLERLSQFGSTPCKAQWRCRACLEPFEYFKCL